MMWIAGAVLTVLSSAFVFAVLFGLPGKDETMEETRCGELEDHEYFWHKKQDTHGTI